VNLHGDHLAVECGQGASDVVKIRDGQVANRPIYVAMGVNMDGERAVLGSWGRPDRWGRGYAS
jgi:hypothetical protein